MSGWTTGRHGHLYRHHQASSCQNGLKDSPITADSRSDFDHAQKTWPILLRPSPVYCSESIRKQACGGAQRELKHADNNTLSIPFHEKYYTSTTHEMYPTMQSLSRLKVRTKLWLIATLTFATTLLIQIYELNVSRQQIIETRHNELKDPVEIGLSIVDAYYRQRAPLGEETAQQQAIERL